MNIEKKFKYMSYYKAFKSSGYLYFEILPRLGISCKKFKTAKSFSLSFWWLFYSFSFSLLAQDEKVGGK